MKGPYIARAGVVGCCYDADGTLSRERLGAFLEAYHAARPLAEAERAALRGSMLGAVRDPTLSFG